MIAVTVNAVAAFNYEVKVMSDIIVNKVIKGDETYLDLTNDTVSEGTLLKNRTAHNSEGIQIQGVMEEGGGSVTGVKGDAEPAYRDGNVNITAANIGTYTASQIDALLNNKVDAHGTDSLMTNAEHVKLAGIEAGAEENVIESISLNGEEITPVNKAVTLSVIDKDVNDLTNYYKKSETDASLGAKQNIILSSTLSIGGQTVTEVEEALGSLADISKSMTGATSSSAGKGGFVPSPSAGDENKALFGDGTWKPVSGGGGGHTILDEDGVTYPQRSKLQFEGCEVTDDAVNDTTIVTCVGGGSIYAKPVMASSSFTYNGSAQSPTLTGFDSEAMTITGDYEATNAGNYSFTVALKDKTKSKWIDNTTTDLVFNWSIGKADSNTTASAASVTLNTSNTSRTVTLSNVTGTVTVSSSDTSVATASVSNNTVTISGVNHKDGSATITISIAASTNYKAKTLTVSVSASYKSTITVTLYSAASDTVSFTDDAGSKTAVTDTSGKKTSVSIVIPYNGKTITFTSSVAKNPSNLSNAYSKSIALTRSTTEIKVMPDGALYWWGYANGIEDCTTANGWSAQNGYTPGGSVQHNTNNICLTGVNSNYSGFGSKNRVNYSKINMVMACSGTPAGVGLAWGVRLTSTKVISDDPQWGWNTANSIKLITYTTAGNTYITPSICNAGRDMTIYALWTE